MIAKPDGADAGLSAGGSFILDPGDTVQVDPYVAGVIMGDPGLARHFDCIPPWGTAAEAPATEVPAAVETVQADQAIEAPSADPEPSRWEPTPKRRRG